MIFEKNIDFLNDTVTVFGLTIRNILHSPSEKFDFNNFVNIQRIKFLKQSLIAKVKINRKYLVNKIKVSNRLALFVLL